MFSRRFALLALLLTLLAGVIATPLAARPVAAQEDATQLLQETAASMAELDSFRFTLTTVQGKSSILSGLELVGVEGAVARPGKFIAEATVKVAIVEVSVKALGIGNRIWVTDPTARGDDYIEITSGDPAIQETTDTLRTLLNPDTFLLRAVDLIEDPVIEGTETIDGVETTKVTGTFDPEAAIAQGRIATPEAGGPADMLVLQPMPVTLWIDDQNRIVRMEIVGQITVNESVDVVRRLDLYDFDATIDIQEPAA